MRQVQSVSRVRRRHAWWMGAALVPAVVLGIAGCSEGHTIPRPRPVSQQPETVTDKGTPFSDLLVPKINASVTDGAVGVSVDAPVTVSAEAGVLGDVTVVGENGERVSGQLSPDGLTWSTRQPLEFNERYTLTAQSMGLGGVTKRQMSFQTHSPQNLTMPYVLPNEGDVVGIGQPVAIRFDEDISDRSAAENAVKVTTSPPVEGAFYWLNNREVRWRPAQYWSPGTKVDVAVNTYGVDLGNGVYGQDNVATHFTIGDAVVATADDNTKTLTIRRNGEVIKTMPISMGKNSAPTNNGVYIIGERFGHMIMDSSTYGVPVNSPNGYRTEVDWATQMSYSGIYVHAAPWSVGSQGYSNVSHGCLNVSTANAQWFFENTKRGDIVEVLNTVGPTLPGTEGLGDWNIPWDQWKAGNSARSR